MISQLFVLLALLSCVTHARPLDIHRSASKLPNVVVHQTSLASCGYETFQSGSQPLFAGRDQVLVGTVEFTLSSSGISVTYTVDDPSCTFTDAVHVNIVNEPLSRVSPGRFPCQDSVSGSPTTFSIDCPASAFSVSCCDDLLVYTHGVLDCGSEEETVFAGDPACSGPRWCNAVTVEPPCECECDGTACVQPQDCGLTIPGSCDAGITRCPADCAPGPMVDCGEYPDTCTFDLVCEMSECEDVTPCAPGTCPPEGVCPNGPDTPEIPATCTAASECPCDGILTCGDPLDPAFCPTQQVTCGSDTCNAGDLLCPDECGMPVACPCEASTTCGDPTDPSECPIQVTTCDDTTCNEGETLCEDMCGAPMDCGLTGCSITACPAECPAMCPPTCECPNCFLPDTSSGECMCVPDPTQNDASCNPCEGVSNSICQDAGLPPSFGCCPDDSGCKSITIPDRIGVTQAELAVSFICSSSCGVTCADITSMGDSRACSLFGSIDLGDDGNPDTDDVLEMCPGLNAD